MSADRNLLFGILALQLNFVTRDQLVEGMNKWVLDKSKTLGELFVDAKAMDGDQFKLLDALVDKHIEKHGGDIEKSLQLLSSVDAYATQLLSKIQDTELEATIQHVSGATVDPDATSPFESAPKRSSNRFRIIRPHAKGGLGEVFVAEDTELSREVALKEIQDRFADNTESRVRFLREAEITGQLEHPGIVPVYGLGTYDDGRPFYAMKFVKGDSLKDAIEKFHSDPDTKAAKSFMTGTVGIKFRELLGRFIDVCDAVHYAHSRGVLHRDLKPGNVMIGEYGETLVVDWGLAKVLGEKVVEGFEHSIIEPSAGSGSTPTMQGSVVGTPAYMSPEQAAGQVNELRATTDVYSLGATLYYLLTGRSAFTSANPVEMLEAVKANRYATPKKVNRCISSSLDAICCKAMSKIPARRYASVKELAADVENLLADRPVSAFPDPIHLRILRSCRTHPRTTATVSGAVIVGTVLATLFGLLLSNKNAALLESVSQLRIAKGEAEQRFKQSQKMIYAKTLQAAWQHWNNGSPKEAFEAMNSCPWDMRGWEFDLAFSEFNRNYVLLDGVHNPGGTHRLCLNIDWTVSVEENATGKNVAKLDLKTESGYTLGRSPDGNMVTVFTIERKLFVFDRDSGTQLLVLDGSDIETFAWRSDSSRLAVVRQNRVIEIWDKTMRLCSWVVKGSPSCIAWTLDSSEVAFQTDNDSIAVFDLDTGLEVRQIPLVNPQIVRCIAFNPNGRSIAIALRGGIIRVVNSITAAEEGSIQANEIGVECLKWSNDGAKLASAGTDGALRIWSPKEGDSHQLFGQLGRVSSIRWSDDCTTLQSAEAIVPTCRSLIWPAEPSNNTIAVDIRGRAAISPDSNKVAAMTDSGIEVWSLVDCSPFMSIQIPQEERAACVCWSPKGDRVVCGSDGNIRFWDASDGRPLYTFAAHAGNTIIDLQWNCKGNYLASLGNDRTIQIWNTADQQIPFKLTRTFDFDENLNPQAFAWSPTGDSIVAGMSVSGGYAGVQILNIESGKVEVTLSSPEFWANSLAWSNDGKHIAIANDFDVKIIDSSTGELVRKLPQSNGTLSIAWSPDNKTLATCGTTRTKIWDTDLGCEVLVLGQNEDAWWVAWSPDQKTLITGHREDLNSGIIRVWTAMSGPDVLPLLGNPLQMDGDYSWDHERERVLARNFSGGYVTWDLRNGRLAEEKVLEPRLSVEVTNASNTLRLHRDGVQRINPNSDDHLTSLQRWNSSRLSKWRAWNESYHSKLSKMYAKTGNWYGVAYHLRLLLEHDRENQKLKAQLTDAEMHL